MNLTLNKSPPSDSVYTFFVDSKDLSQWWSHYVYRSPSSHIIPHNRDPIHLTPAPLVFLCRRKLIEKGKWWWYDRMPQSDIEARYTERYSAIQFGPHIDGSWIWEEWPCMQVGIELPNPLMKLYFRNSLSVNGWRTYMGELEVIDTRPQFPLRFYAAYICENCHREIIVPLSVGAAGGKYFNQCKNRMIIPEPLRNPLEAACEFFFSQILTKQEDTGLWTCEHCKPTPQLLFIIENAEDNYVAQLL